ncbi:MAG: hypothetical protein ACREJ0_12680, partial [Geminicoccaceae bacterium]
MSVEGIYPIFIRSARTLRVMVRSLLPLPAGHSTALGMDEQPDDRAVAAHRGAAEAKRLEARRRFLLGSGAALSALVTMSPGRVGAVTYAECAAGMDWMTMSLEARNLAYNNVAHVGPDFAPQITESWAAASKALREQRPKHLDLAYAPGEWTK